MHVGAGVRASREERERFVFRVFTICRHHDTDLIFSKM